VARWATGGRIAKEDTDGRKLGGSLGGKFVGVLLFGESELLSAADSKSCGVGCIGDEGGRRGSKVCYRLRSERTLLEKKITNPEKGISTMGEENKEKKVRSIRRICLQRD